MQDRLQESMGKEGIRKNQRMAYTNEEMGFNSMCNVYVLCMFKDRRNSEYMEVSLSARLGCSEPHRCLGFSQESISKIETVSKYLILTFFTCILCKLIHT